MKRLPHNAIKQLNVWRMRVAENPRGSQNAYYHAHLKRGEEAALKKVLDWFDRCRTTPTTDEGSRP